VNHSGHGVEGFIDHTQEAKVKTGINEAEIGFGSRRGSRSGNTRSVGLLILGMIFSEMERGSVSPQPFSSTATTAPALASAVTDPFPRLSLLGVGRQMGWIDILLSGTILGEMTSDTTLVTFTSVCDVGLEQSWGRSGFTVSALIFQTFLQLVKLRCEKPMDSLIRVLFAESRSNCTCCSY
jgi:hypothetical protein